MLKKRIVYIIFIIIALGGGVYFFQRRNQPTKVETQTLKKQEMADLVIAPGETKAKKDVSLNFEMAGKVTWLNKEEGDRVEKYETIAALDTTDLNNAVSQAEVLYQKAQSDYTEIKETYKVEEPTNVIREKINQVEKDVEYYRLKLESARQNLQDAYLTSPIDGKLVSLNAEVGEYVNVTSSVARVVDLNSLYFLTEVAGAEIGKVQKGQEASLSLDSFEYEMFKGKVTKVEQTASVSSGGEDYFGVEITFNTLPELPLGLTGDATITISTKKAALLVPFESVIEEGETSYLLSIENGQAKRVKVEVEEETADYIEISRVEEGFVYITDPENIQEGDSVLVTNGQ